MQRAPDFSFGYDYNPTTKVTRKLAQRAIPSAAPAGAINSSARDMAQWLRLMLANGTFNGKRLVSEKGFDELIKKQINIAGPVDYGLGWFLRQWNGHKVIEHGGNIDGFNAQVALMPDQKLGFVLLTNVTASPLGAVAMNTIWKNLVEVPTTNETAFRPVKDKESETELFLEQPQGNLVLPKVAVTAEAAPAANAPELIGVDELLAKMIAAYGGEENLRKHKSSLTTVEIDLENQGVQAQGTISARAPNLTASEMTFTALDKDIGSLVTYFDGTTGGELLSFAPEETYSGKRLEDVKTGSDFYDVFNWKNNYKTITVKRIAKVGDEDAYVVEKRSEKGTPVIDYISTKSFLVLRRDTVIVSETAGIELPQTQTFSDYQKVDGVLIPFTFVSNNLANGKVVVRVVDVKFDVAIPDAVFKKPAADKNR